MLTVLDKQAIIIKKLVGINFLWQLKKYLN